VEARAFSAGPDRRRAFSHLRTVVRQAKRDWAERTLTEATNDDNMLWKVAKWRKGRSSNVIPPIRTSATTISADHAEVTRALHARFFPHNPLVIPSSQPTDPMPRTQRPHNPITESEVKSCLTDTSNTSAPGPSGIGYHDLKWAFEAVPSRFTALFNKCLTTGCHPWRDTKIVVLPKPNKPDYTAPKAYRPISLLECCGKLLEKVIAKRIMHESNQLGLISPHQFGSRDYHCTTDAILAVTHNAESCIRSGTVGTLILFDIQGFFDNINPDRAIHMFELMGFSREVCEWIRAFLAPRTAYLRFNNKSSETFLVTTGTPQGSPLSPILSAVYTSLMLESCNNRWQDKSVHLYVDDGAIFASGPTMRTSIRRAVEGLEEVLQWLAANGLKTDSDKSEIMLFHPNRYSPDRLGSPPTAVAYRDPFTGAVEVKIKRQVRYLGVFIDARLTWHAHVKTVASRARSTIRSLNILGNSMRGIRFATWRRLFHAIIIPILTYGAPVWHPETGRRAALIHPLQVAQNDALRKMSGCFRTTPVDPLHSLLAIPPIDYTIRKLVRSYGDRLQRSPPTHLLLTILSHNPAAIAWNPRQPTSTLRRILRDAPRVQPTFTLPSAPYDTHLSHTRLTPPPTSRLTAADHVHTRQMINHPKTSSINLYLYELPVNENAFITAWVLYDRFTLQHHGTASHGTRTGSLLHALADITSAASALATTAHRTVNILLPSRLPYPYILLTSKHRYLDASHTITDRLRTLLNDPSQRSVTFRWYSQSWACARTVKRDCAPHPPDPNNPAPHTLTGLAPAATPTPSNPPTNRKDEMYSDWHADYCARTHPEPYFQSCTPPDSNRPPPFIRGALSRGSRRLYTAAVQLTTGHAFTSTYSLRFRPSANDNTTCQCSDTKSHRESHSARHVILYCKRVRTQRRIAFGTHSPSWDHIFTTFTGGFQLAEFLFLTQELLFPLPPEPP
jgi:hypothetical protein